MKVKFKKLHEDAVLPSYAKAGDAGMDLTCVEHGKLIKSPDDASIWYYIEFKTGLSVEIPNGYVGLLFPRSSISKTAMVLANSVGVVDSGYRGEICVRFKLDYACAMPNDENKNLASIYLKGDRIAQLMIVPYPTIEPEFAEEVSETERGEGGFGSSGT